MTTFPFLDLPLEPRHEVYSHHLQLSSPTAYVVHEQAKYNTPFLGVSKQIYGEVFDILQHKTAFYLSISWQGVASNGLALFDIKSHPTRLDCGRMLPVKVVAAHAPSAIPHLVGFLDLHLPPSSNASPGGRGGEGLRETFLSEGFFFISTSFVRRRPASYWFEGGGGTGLE